MDGGGAGRGLHGADGGGVSVSAAADHGDLQPRSSDTRNGRAHSYDCGRVSDIRRMPDGCDGRAARDGRDAVPDADELCRVLAVWATTGRADVLQVEVGTFGPVDRTYAGADCDCVWAAAPLAGRRCACLPISRELAE